MPFTDDLSVPEINFGFYAPSFDKPDDTNLLGAAFRQENDVYNAVQYLSRPDFTADPHFDFAEKTKDSVFFQYNPDAFMGVRSEAEWAFTEAKLARERKDRERIAQGGAAGIFASIAAGVLSPTILIPVGGSAKAVGSGIKAAGEAAAMVALGASIQEGVLHLNQDERTLRESVIGVSTAAALGAVLGGAIQYATKKEVQSLTDNMAKAATADTILPAAGGAPMGLSAEAASKEAIASYVRMGDPGHIASTAIPISDFAKKLHLPESVAKALSLDWLGPVSRGLASKNAVRRTITNQLSNASVYTQAAVRGESTLAEGTVEQLIKQHWSQTATANHELKGLYREWFVNSGRGGTFRSWLPSGSYKDFLNEVGNVMFEHIEDIRRADVPEELHKAADIMLDNVYRSEIKTAREAGLESWVQLRDENYALRIATQQLKRDLASRETGVVRKILAEHALEVLRAKPKPEGVSEDVAAVLGKGPKAESFSEAELADLADQIAEELLPKMLGEYGKNGVVPALHELGEKAAKYMYIDPTKVWSNGRTYGEFLEKDVEKLSRSFVRSIAPDVELYRAFKTTTPEVFDNRVDVWKDYIGESEAMKREAEALTDPRAREKALAEIHKDSLDFQRDMKTMVGRLKHEWGTPADPTSFPTRLGRAALQLNTMRLMGGVVISSFADLGRIIMRTGFTNTFKHGIIPLLTDLRRLNLTAREVRYAGTALDVYNHGRSGMMFDLFDELEYGNMAERFMQYGTSKIGIVALFDYWNVAMKQFSGAVWAGTVSDALEAAASGTATKWQKTMLAHVNISDARAAKMMKLMKSGEGGAEVSPGVWLPNTEAWSQVADEEIEAGAEQLLKKWKKKPEDMVPGKDGKPGTISYGDKARHEAFTTLHKDRRSLQRNFRAAMAQLVDTTITTPGIERPNWVDGSTPGRLIAQFRSFTLSSTYQVARLAAQDARYGNMAPVILGSAFSLALGAMSYYAWGMSVGGRTRERVLKDFDDALNGDSHAMRRLADEATNRSGLMGVLSEVQKFAERVPAVGQYTTFAGTPPTRSPYISPFFDAFGPTGNIVDNLDNILMTLDDPTSSTFRSAKQLMPYQNLMFIRQYFDALNDDMMRRAGVSPQ